MVEQKVIGGEFRIDADILRNRVRQNNIPEYSLGRTCLYAILNTLKNKIGGVLIPDYICSTVGEVPKRLKLNFLHYHVDRSFKPNLESIEIALSENNMVKPYAIVLVSYFGMINLDDIVHGIRDVFPETVIIIDDVQNYYGFGAHPDYDYCFSSYRKWFPVPDGADIVSSIRKQKNEIYFEQGTYADFKCAGNLLKNHTDIMREEFLLKLLEQGEDQMDIEYRYRCSDVSRNLFNRIDLDRAAERRKQNAKYLHEELAIMGFEHLYNPDTVPLFIPVLMSDRDYVQKKLFGENIFTPIHWPLKDEILQGKNVLYEEELSLICDQRYDEIDMERTIRGIKDAIRYC